MTAARARNLFEALQAIVLVHLALHAEGQGYSVSPGRLDQVLAPYFDGAPETRDLLGTATEGPTAILNSVRKATPARYWAGGYNLNVTLPLAAWGVPAMRDKLVAMIDVFFADGGQELQINSLDPELLRLAIARPEQYGHLMVRIAGFNAFFVKLAPREQEEILARALQACGAMDGAPNPERSRTASPPASRQETDAGRNESFGEREPRNDQHP